MKTATETIKEIQRNGQRSRTETTTFTNAGIDAKDHLVFTTGAGAESGTVDLITVTVYYYRT